MGMTVPFRQSPPGGDTPQTTTLQPAPPPDVYSMMAAVQMHREGRLVDPWPMSDNIEDRRGRPANDPDVSAWTPEAQDRRNFNLDKTPGDDPGTAENFMKYSNRLPRK